MKTAPFPALSGLRLLLFADDPEIGSKPQAKPPPALDSGTPCPWPREPPIGSVGEETGIQDPERCPWRRRAVGRVGAPRRSWPACKMKSAPGPTLLLVSWALSLEATRPTGPQQGGQTQFHAACCVDTAICPRGLPRPRPSAPGSPSTPCTPHIDAPVRTGKRTLVREAADSLLAPSCWQMAAHHPAGTLSLLALEPGLAPGVCRTKPSALCPPHPCTPLRQLRPGILSSYPDSPSTEQRLFSRPGLAPPPPGSLPVVPAVSPASLLPLRASPRSTRPPRTCTCAPIWKKGLRRCDRGEGLKTRSPCLRAGSKSDDKRP